MSNVKLAAIRSCIDGWKKEWRRKIERPKWQNGQTDV